MSICYKILVENVKNLLGDIPKRVPETTLQASSTLSRLRSPRASVL